NATVKMFFSFRGRLSRKGWWLGQSVIIPAAIAAHYVFGLDLAPWILLPWLLELAVITKRLNDRGHRTWVIKAVLYATAGIFVLLFREHLDPSNPGWIELGLFIAAIAGLFVIIDNGFLPGTRGPNRYGPDPVAWSRILVDGPEPDSDPIANI